MKQTVKAFEEKRILITGTHGFVGARAREYYPDAVAVPSELVRAPGEALRRFVQEQCPDVILNAAAISDIGTCERDPDGSYSSNVLLPVTLAEVSHAIGAKLISFSSDQVYTGCTDEGPWQEETALPPPANVYARHKLEAEERVLAADPDAVLLRATWMYDMPLFGHANRDNFLVNVLQAAMHRRRMSFFREDHRGITYVREVVGLLDRVMCLPGGVYNYGSENPLGMYDTAVAMLKALGLEELTEALLEALPGRGRAHALWMSCDKLRRHGICFPDTAEGFRRCAEDYALSRSMEKPR